MLKGRKGVNVFMSIEECAGNWNQFYEVKNFGYQKWIP